jgi:hypothetical protein
VKQFYREFRSYLIRHGGVVARLSLAKPGGGPEYFMVVPGPGGRGWRDRKAEALDQLDDAMARGDTQGEVWSWPPLPDG